MSQTLILVNPRAREGEVESRWPEIEKELLAALKETSASVVKTTAEDYGSGTVRKFLKSGGRKVVVVGGDGTISEAVQGFFENGRTIAPDAVLAIMPAGRGDDFFKSVAGRTFGGSKDAWKRGLEILKTGKPCPTDLGRVDILETGDEKLSRYFINITSFGYPGLVVKRVLSGAGVWGRSKIGKSAWTYILQSLSALIEYKPISMQIKMDGHLVYEGPVFSGFVLNGRYNAGGSNWSEEAQIDDGLFHLTLFEPRNIASTLMTMPRMLTGRWQDVKGVRTAVGKQIDVKLSHPGGERSHPLLEIDGDQPERAGTRGARFEILPGAIQIWR